MVDESEQRAVRSDAHLSRQALALGPVLAAAVVLAQANGAPVLAAVSLLAAGLTAVAGLVVGLRRYRPAHARPWRALMAASVLFLVGATARQALHDTATAPLADALTLSGYAAALLAMVSLLRARGSVTGERHELADGVIVLTAAGCLAVSFLTIPTLTETDLPRTYAAVQGLYPLIDVAVIGVLVLLAWTTAASVASYRLLFAAFGCVLVGDLAYAVLARRGELVGPPVVDLPFVLAFVLLAGAAVHPSMPTLSAVQQRPVQAWSWARVAVLAPCAAVPSALLLRDDLPTTERVVLAAAAASTLAAVLVRAAGAVHAHSRAQDVLRHQATHDVLTDLPNRAHLVSLVADLVERARREGGRVEVACLDLDGFQLVNESWGHDTGDGLLQEAAARLRESVPPPGVAARAGGDEFVVAQHVRDPLEEPGQSTGDRLLEAYRRPLPLLGRSFVITASVGVVSGSPTADRRITATGLLRDADTAMHRAKKAGRNQWVAFDQSMHESVRSRAEIEMELRGALDRGELSLAYQPVVALADSRLQGFEALLRWQHPVMGSVPPLDFVGIAEETGLIVDIGRWVLSTTLTRYAGWDRPDLSMSVNVSPRQLADPGLVDHVHTELQRTGVAASRLTLEITESVLADEVESLGVVRQLRGLGVRISVDDFGTGYSSLAHLRRFPVHSLKVDRSFVSGVADDAGAEAIVRAVVALAHEMDLQVVAEGVESESQARVLLAMGIESAQGWLYGRPEPPEALEERGLADLVRLNR